MHAQQSYKVAHIRGLGLNMGARRLQCAIALSRRRSAHDQLSADSPGRLHAVGITYADPGGAMMQVYKQNNECMPIEL